MESEEFFAFLGRYFVFFQWIESQLDAIILTARGTENWEKSQLSIAKMRNEQKVKEVEAILLAPELISHLKLRPEWETDVRDLVMRLGKERIRRNEFAHSQYLFDFLEAGLPPLRSNRRRKEGELHFDQEFLGIAKTDAVLKEVASLAFDLSQAKLQLVHVPQRS